MLGRKNYEYEPYAHDSALENTSMLEFFGGTNCVKCALGLINVSLQGSRRWSESYNSVVKFGVSEHL